MMEWSRYFTPVDIASQLVESIRLKYAPRAATDICAGSGNLLRAVADRWPSARLVGNDRYRRQAPAGIRDWSSYDGRTFALTLAERGEQYDVVVGNPPFGRTKPLKQIIRSSVREDSFLKSPRLEVGMTVAAAKLVSPRGVLASVLPETVLFGDKNESLRSWLSGHFCCFEFRRIPRRSFAGQDLGLVMLVCYREHVGRCCLPLPSGRLREAGMKYSAIRGTVNSKEFNARGAVDVVHCSGAGATGSYTLHRMKKSDVAAAARTLMPGDILVNRVGRGAGRVGIFTGSSGTFYTDCVFCLRMERRRDQKRLSRFVKNGRLEKLLTKGIRGLGAQYVTKQVLDAAVDECLPDFR
jgi:hypothetical protein